MCNFLKLLYAEWFGSKDAKLNGSNLFCDEYKNFVQFTTINKLFGLQETPFVRIPFPSSQPKTFLQSAKYATQQNINVIALLDAYESNTSMMNRLNTLKDNYSFIKYIELFNELPHMNDLYPGEKINSLQELLEKTNQYTDWIHKNIPGIKVITMAPYNNMDERSFSTWGGITNTRILKELILYTVADISAIHLYGNNLSKKLQLVQLANDIKSWNKEANYKKKFWITECGDEPWNVHISYYDKLIKLIRNTIDPEVIIWYRQCVKFSTEQDNGFALEALNTLQVSPLYQKLIS